MCYLAPWVAACIRPACGTVSVDLYALHWGRGVLDEQGEFWKRKYCLDIRMSLLLMTPV